ncbi:hypothetical protein AB5I41_19115 [Sphingomonas sp. MMS24-JH45]
MIAGKYGTRESAITNLEAMASATCSPAWNLRTSPTATMRSSPRRWTGCRRTLSRHTATSSTERKASAPSSAR